MSISKLLKKKGNTVTEGAESFLGVSTSLPLADPVNA